MANVSAQLGLVITAQDKVSSVFGEIATKLGEAFGSMNADARAFGETMNSVTEVSTGDSTKMIEGLDRIGETLIGVKQELTSLGETAQQSGEKFDSMGVAIALQDIGQRATEAGTKITEFFTKAVEDGAEFQQKISAISATLNSKLPESARLSKEQVEALDKAALSMGQSGYFSANSIAEGMYTLAQQGLNYKEIMGGAMASVQDLAVATDSNLADTANVVTDVYHEMGEALKDEFGTSMNDQFTGIANSISGAMHNARMSMDDYLNTMKYVGPQAGALGLSIRDLTVGISLLAEHGIRGSQAGTTLRRALTNLIPSTDAAKQKLEELGFVTKNGTNVFVDQQGRLKSLSDIHDILHSKLEKLTEAERQQAINMLFGQYAMAGMTIYTGATNEKLQELTDEIFKNSDAQELAKAKWDNTAGAIRRLSAHFQTIIKQIGNDLSPIVDMLVSKGQALLSWFDSLNPTVKKTIEYVAAIAGVALLVVGSLATLGASILMLQFCFKGLSPLVILAQGNFQSLIGAAKMLGGGLLSLVNPLTIGIAVFVSLAIAVYECYKHFPKFRAFCDDMIKGIEERILDGIKCFENFCSTTKQKLIDFWTNTNATGHTKMDAFRDTFRVGFDLIKGDWSKAWEDIKILFKNQFKDITNIDFDRFLQLGKNIVNKIIEGLKSIHIPVPHFGMDPNFSIANALTNPSSIASAIKVTWMADGGILNAPAMIGMNGASPIVAGEAGPEAVMPLSKLPELLGLNNERKGFGLRRGNIVNNITVNVHGSGKDGKQIGNDIAKELRLQMSMVSI